MYHNSHVPKKSLGQHFLTSKGAVIKIIEAAALISTDTILEIGPGTGVLTSALIEAVNEAGRVVAVEKDELLARELRITFAASIAHKKLHLITGDILTTPPATLGLQRGSYKLVANIPYYITGEIIRTFFETSEQPSSMTLLVQKEVADRIVARDGKESILSISVKAYGTPHYIHTVKAGSFNPPPKVDSAILHISTISKNFFKTFSEEHFFTIVRGGFAHKRKLLSSNLREIFPTLELSRLQDIFSTCGIDAKSRAEDVTLAQWHSLAKNLLP